MHVVVRQSVFDAHVCTHTHTHNVLQVLRMKLISASV